MTPKNERGFRVLEETLTVKDLCVSCGELTEQAIFAFEYNPGDGNGLQEEPVRVCLSAQHPGNPWQGIESSEE